MLFAISHSAFVISAIVNVFIGLFTPIVIIKIQEFSRSFTIQKIVEEQKPAISDDEELNTHRNQMLITDSIKVADSGESFQKEDNKLIIVDIHNWKKIIFAIDKSINEIMKLKNSILPVWTFVSYKIINYKWVMNFIAFWMVYWFVRWCCTQMNRHKLLKPMILSEDVAFFMWIFEFELYLKANNLDHRDKQIKELIKIFEFNILS